MELPGCPMSALGTPGAGTLTAAEVGAGVWHHVALSVVGTDRVAGQRLFPRQARQERLIKSSLIPYTLIHATQFFEFARAIAQFPTDGDTVRLPSVLFQPIAAEDVASAIAEAALIAVLRPRPRPPPAWVRSFAWTLMVFLRGNERRTSDKGLKHAEVVRYERSAVSDAMRPIGVGDQRSSHRHEVEVSAFQPCEQRGEVVFGQAALAAHHLGHRVVEG
jgi:hypothetical protein